MPAAAWAMAVASILQSDSRISSDARAPLLAQLIENVIVLQQGLLKRRAYVIVQKSEQSGASQTSTSPVVYVWRRNMRQHEAAVSLPRLVGTYDDAIRAVEVTFVGLTFGKCSASRLVDLAGSLDALARPEFSRAILLAQRALGPELQRVRSSIAKMG